MALNFPNVSILGFNQNSRTFDAGLRYSNLVKINIEGLVIDLTQEFGITGVWNGNEGVLATIAKNNNYQDLILNGRSFGSGRIESINFNAGQDVRTKVYNAQITVYDSGNLFNLGGTYYNTINSGNFRFLEEFSEDYNFERKINGGYSYNHNANIRFNSGVGNLNAINTAKTLAKTLFTGANLGFLFYSGYTNKTGKRFYTESYNLIDNECVFNETFNFDSDSGNYSVTRTNTFDLAENGNISTTENGNIRGITFPTYKAAISAISSEMVSAYNRCNEVFNLYAPDGSSPLINSPVVQSKVLDVFNNNVNYSVTFENNIRNSGTYFWDYTQTVERNEGIANVSENGTIIGRGNNRESAYQASVAGFNIVRAGIGGRTTTLYTDVFGNAYNYLDKKEEQFSPYKSTCNYTYQFTNELVTAGTLGVKKIKIVQDDSFPLYKYNKINVIAVKEIAQDDYSSTLASRTVSLELYGEKIIPLSSYLENAKTQFNLLIPIEQNPNIDSAQYTFDPNQNVVNASLSWNYTEVKNAGNISL